MRMFFLIFILTCCRSFRQQRSYDTAQKQWFSKISSKEAFLQHLFPSRFATINYQSGPSPMPRAMMWVLMAKKGYGQSPFEDDAYFPPSADDDEVLEDDEDDDIDDGIDNVTGLRSVDEDDWESGDGEDEDEDSFDDSGNGKDSYSESDSLSDSSSDRLMTWKERLASQERRRSGGGRSWEDKFLEDPLKGNNPTVEIPVERPLGRFRRTYVAIGHVADPTLSGEQDEDELTDRMFRREQAWLPHMQWARRSVLLDYDSESGGSEAAARSPAKVENAYTLLCEHSLRPVAQVLVLRANSSRDVDTLLGSEPLSGHGALFRGDGRPAWRVLRLQAVQHEEDEETLCATLRPDPFLFVGLYPDPEVQSQRARQLFDATQQFHVEQNTGEQASRVALLGRLLAVDPAAEERMQRRQAEREAAAGQEGAPGVATGTGEEEEGSAAAAAAEEEDDEQEEEEDEDEDEDEEGQVVGVMTLFSAKSVRDAERYILAADTAASTALGSKSAGRKQLYKESLLSPVNIQDVSGSHHTMARNFGEKSELDKIHFMDPEDLLLLGPATPSLLNPDLASSDSSSPNPLFLAQLQEEQEGDAFQLLQPLEAIAGRPNHFADNAAALQQLQQDGVSYRYSRLDLEERLGEGMEEAAVQWNKAMLKFQKTLMKSAAAESGIAPAFNVDGLTAEKTEKEADRPAVAAAKAAKKAAEAAFTKDSLALLTSLTAASENEGDII